MLWYVPLENGQAQRPPQAASTFEAQSSYLSDQELDRAILGWMVVLAEEQPLEG